jgi:hypothetical protein
VLLKLVMPVMLEDTVSVMIAAVDCPAASCVPCWFQVTVMYVLAPAGFQLLAAKFRVIVPVPVFLT